MCTCSSIWVKSVRVRSHFSFPRRFHIEAKSHCDIYLDTSPYNSHTTAFEALLSHLPIVTLPTSTIVSRVTASLLTNLHIHQTVSSHHMDYENVVVWLANADSAKTQHIKGIIQHTTDRGNVRQWMWEYKHLLFAQAEARTSIGGLPHIFVSTQSQESI